MRPITKTNRTNADGSPLTFNHWGDAKIDLQTELGCYCSFCEREGYRSSLDVEHILPKNLPKYRDQAYRWDNFLIGCKNCNATKGAKDYQVNETYLPHLNNLLCTIDILDGGTIQIKQGLTEEDERRTKNFIDLVGLDRDPSHPAYSTKDDRWEARMEVWGIAVKYLNDYQNNEIKLARILDMAKFSGYWSIWMAVFKQYPDVKRELIKAFPGTASDCFDENFNPISRP